MLKTNTVKRISAFFLALMMILGTLPLNVFAEGLQGKTASPIVIDSNAINKKDSDDEEDSTTGSKTHTISFNPNGGSGEMKPVEVADGKNYTLPKNEFKAPEGKKFKNWLIEDQEQKEGYILTVTRDLELKANWEEAKTNPVKKAVKSLLNKEKNKQETKPTGEVSVTEEQLKDQLELSEEIIPDAVGSDSNDKTKYATIDSFSYTSEGGEYNTIENYYLNLSMDSSVFYKAGDYVDIRIGNIDVMGTPYAFYQNGTKIASIVSGYELSEHDGGYFPRGNNTGKIRITFNQNITNRRNIKMSISSWISSGVRYSVDDYNNDSSIGGTFTAWLTDRPNDKKTGKYWTQYTTTINPYASTSIYNDKYSDGRYKGAINFYMQNGGYAGGINDNRNLKNEKFTVELDGRFDISSIKAGSTIKSLNSSILKQDLVHPRTKIQHDNNDDNSGLLEIVSVSQGNRTTPSRIVVKPLTSIPSGSIMKFKISNLPFSGYVNFSQKNGGIPNYKMFAQDSSLWRYSNTTTTNSALDEKANFSSEIVRQATNVIIKTNKKLLDASGKEKKLNGGEFTFKLIGSDGKSIEAKNDANGNVSFPKIEFNKAGTYKYEISELETLNGKSNDEIIFDSNKIPVTVTITENSTNSFNSLVGYDGKNTFVNKEISPVSIAIKANKKYIDAKGSSLKLKDGEFSFELYKEGNSKPIQVVKNKTDGSVVFNDVEFTKPGTYKYSIKEVNGSNDNIEYDTETKNVTIEVKLDKNKKLQARIINNEMPVFTNKMLGSSLQIVKLKDDTKPFNLTEIKSGNSISSYKIPKDKLNNTLDGAEFKIYKLEEGKETLIKTVVTKDGITPTIDGLTLGKYKIKETKAPKGYLISKSDLEFEITNKDLGDSIVKFVADESIVDMPSTGGQGTKAFVIGGGILIAVMMGVVLTAKKKKEN